MRLKTTLTSESPLDQKKADHYGVHFVRNFITDQHVYDQIHELFTSAPYEYSHSTGRSNEPYNSYPARSENTEEQKALMDIIHEQFQAKLGHLLECFNIDRPSNCYLLRYNEHTPEDSDLHVTKDLDSDRPVVNVVFSINSALTTWEENVSNTGAIAVSKYKGGLYPNNTTRDVAYYPIPHNSLYFIVGSQVHHGIAKTFCNRYVIVLSYPSADSAAVVGTKLKRPALPVEVFQCKQCFNYYLSQEVLRTHVQTHISNDNRRDRQRSEKLRQQQEREALEKVDRGEEGSGDEGRGLLADNSSYGERGILDATAPVEPIPEDEDKKAEAVAAAVVAAAVDANNSDSEDSTIVKVLPKKVARGKRKREEEKEQQEEKA